jgi:hypothetical protein
MCPMWRPTRRQFLRGSLVAFVGAALNGLGWGWGRVRAAGRKIKISVTTPGAITWTGQIVAAVAGGGLYSNTYADPY